MVPARPGDLGRAAKRSATPCGRTSPPTKTPASSPNAIALPVLRIFRRRPSVRAAARYEPTKLILGTPANCGSRTSCLPRSPSPASTVGNSRLRPHGRTDPDEATLPDDLLEIIRHGAAPGADRSEVFHKVIADSSGGAGPPMPSSSCSSATRTASPRSTKGLRQEVERSYGKIAGGAAPAVGQPGPAAAAAGPAPGAAPRRITSFRLSVSSPESYRDRRSNCAGIDRRARRSSPGAAPWSSRSGRPWPRPTGARPSPPGCARYRSIPCSGRSPTLRSSSV